MRESLVCLIIISLLTMLSKLNKGAEVISAPQPSGTTTSSNLKRKHGYRRRNQILERGQLVIEQLGDKGEPV
jgi:hypothetical protein